MLVLPAHTSIQVAKSFKQTLVLSPIFGLTSVILGLLLSLVLDTASGATIVLVGLLMFGAVLATKKARKIFEPPTGQAGILSSPQS